MIYSQDKFDRTSRGSALLMALVITVVLFIMGLAFVSTTQTDKATVSAVNELNSLDVGIEAVVEKINTVLVVDLFGGDDEMLNNDASDEYYDYPGADDPWLASLEPKYVLMSGVDFYYWPHLTDLYQNDYSGAVFGLPAGMWFSPESRDVADDEQWDGSAASSLPYWVDIANNLHAARVISDDVGTEVIVSGGDWDDLDDVWLWGAQADADGDGVADARWVKVPDITGPNGQNIYTAVRIVDNGGMININTAYRDPTYLTANSGDWDGSRLSHINLEGIRKGADNVGLLQEERFGGGRSNTVSAIGGSPTYLDYSDNDDNDEKYEEEVALRILNPKVVQDSGNDYHYFPFDITDEIELRNRFFIDSLTTARMETSWLQTFIPGHPNQRINPFYDEINGEETWYKRTSADALSSLYHRRHICTAYSFDRIIRPWFDTTTLPTGMDAPNGERKAVIKEIASTATLEGQTVEQLAGAIYMGLPDDAVIQDRFGQEYDREKLAWQFAANLIDYQDDDTPSVPTAIQNGNFTYFGVEDLSGLKRDILCVSKIGYINVDSSTTAPPAPGGVPDGEYYAIEIFNPDDTAAKDLVEYEIRITDAAGNPIGTLLSLPAHSLATFPGNDTAVVVITSVATATVANAQAAFSMTTAPITIFTTGSNLQSDNRIIIAKRGSGGYPISGVSMPVDYVTVQGAMVFGGDNTTTIMERTKTFPLTNFLLPEPSVLINLWGPAVGGLGVPIIAGDLTDITSAEMEGIDKVQLLESSEELRSLGEIEKVMAIGFFCDETDGIYRCRTLMQDILESQIAVKANDPCSDQQSFAPTPSTIEMGSFARIRLDDPCYWGLMNYLTCLDPSNDDVDNDGSDFTSDNPMNDGYDQDGDHEDAPAHLVGLPPAQQPVPPYTAGPDNDEEQAQWYEQRVAGRININTAPWYVIKQLPWLGWRRISNGNYFVDNDNLAKGIVAFRDKIDISAAPVNGPDYSGPTGRGTETGITGIDEDAGFKNIAQILQVITTTVTPLIAPSESLVSAFDIRHYLDTKNEDASNLTPPWPPGGTGAPDYSTDIIVDDFEERNLLFDRVSNLVTVRSDVFTAYILVRVGENGPQKRVIAIFDRSGVYSKSDRPKLVALHPVPDPR